MNTKVKLIISFALLVLTAISGVFSGTTISAAAQGDVISTGTVETRPLTSSTAELVPSTGTSDGTQTYDDASPKYGTVYLDLENSSLLIGKGYPVPVSVVLQGNLPDPCHKLVVEVSPPNAVRQINLDVYTVFDPQQTCVTVLQPFTESIYLGMFLKGSYSVYINGQLFEKFTVPSQIGITAR